MSNLFRNTSWKTALIAGVTVAILAIIAIAGTAVYLRSKAQTEAVDFDSNQATSQNVDSGNSKRNEEENRSESENQDTNS